MGTYFEGFKDHGSNLHMALRLLRVGMRPINGIVDVTNYLMLETSQPTHAYDADHIKDKKVIIRMAKKDETLKLLDNSDLSLFAEDLVIADPEKILGLAGVKGGLHDSINENTHAVFFEAAHFDATTVRRGAARHKTRTDASARFEKTLDPNQLELTTSRFIELAQKFNINLTMVGAPIIIGNPDTKKTLTITHDFLVSRSGINLSVDQVIKPLQKLGFDVTENVINKSYDVIIPTFRGTKDVQILEDILEEVIRMYGFETITPTNPAIQQKSENLTPLMRLRNIKKYLSSGAQMLEQQNYAFFDEDFMNKIGWQTEELIELKHPVSEQFKRLVTTLIPNLLKNVYENFVGYDSLAFFECARSWNPLTAKEHGERKKVAGVFFEKRKPVDFYEHKQIIQTLLNLCNIKDVEWKKVTPEITALNPWMRPFQVAQLFVGDTSIGYAGKADPKLLLRCDALPESDAFIFELDAEFLFQYKAPVIQLAPLPKFQGSSFDLSMMVPLKCEATTIEQILAKIDPFIENVMLIDFFEKENWNDQRSLAFRIWIRNPHATITKEEIEALTKTAINAVQKQGAVIRV
jgi:phenylalanyl-tRNA synthetase beta chain